METEHIRTSKVGTTPDIQLTPSQQKMHDTVLDYLRGKLPAYQSVLIRGYAGTGKTTTLVKTLDDYIKENPNVQIAVTAPTHKAVQVLREQRSLGDKVTYATIHSLLGVKESKDYNTGKIRFVPAYGENGPRITQFGVVIVDEVSMLGKPEGNSEEINLYEELMAWVISRNLKLIMMGDPVQIPPVNASEAQPFQKKVIARDRILSLELSEIMRQKGDSCILGFATAIRHSYLDRVVLARSYFDFPATDVTLIPNHDEEVIRSMLTRLFTDPRAREDPDFVKVIAWRNATVNLYNVEIRKILYGDAARAALLPGEKLVAFSPVIQINRILDAKEIVLNNNEEVTVQSLETKSTTVKWYGGFMDDSQEMTVQYYNATVYQDYLNPEGEIKRRTLKVDVLHENSVTKFNEAAACHKKAALNARTDAKKKSLWKLYFDNMEKFADMGYNYAITAHKSQGSTYENAIVIEWDIHKNFNTAEANRIKYVAVTRASKRLYIIT